MFYDDYNPDAERFYRQANGMKKELSKEEEKDLFSQFYGKNGNLTVKEIEARNTVINSYLWLAVAIGSCFARSRGIDREELVSEAACALIRAVDKYNPSAKSGNFRFYAASVIENALKLFCWQNNRIISVPKDELRQAYALHKAEEHLIFKLQREPTVSELSAECQMTEKQVRRLQIIPLSVNSYDTVLPKAESDDEANTEDPPMLIECLSNEEDTQSHFPASTRVTHGDLLRILREELKKLSKFEYELIKYRFNLDRFVTADTAHGQVKTTIEEPPLFCSDISLYLNCTRSKLVHAKYAVLQKLRRAIITRFKEEFGVVRIPPEALKKVLAKEFIQKQKGIF